jgi:hypothetical protein
MPPVTGGRSAARLLCGRISARSANTPIARSSWRSAAPRAKDRLAYATNGAADALADWIALRGQEPGPLLVPLNKGGRLGRAA